MQLFNCIICKTKAGNAFESELIRERYDAEVGNMGNELVNIALEFSFPRADSVANEGNAVTTVNDEASDVTQNDDEVLSEPSSLWIELVNYRVIHSALNKKLYRKQYVQKSRIRRNRQLSQRDRQRIISRNKATVPEFHTRPNFSRQSIASASIRQTKTQND